jgi:hypothetical protein
MSDYLRSRGATIEVAALVAQIRGDLGGYYSEEQVYNTLVAHNNSADAARSALTRAYYFSSSFFTCLSSWMRASSAWWWIIPKISRSLQALFDSPPQPPNLALPLN